MDGIEQVKDSLSLTQMEDGKYNKEFRLFNTCTYIDKHYTKVPLKKGDNYDIFVQGLAGLQGQLDDIIDKNKTYQAILKYYLTEAENATTLNDKIIWQYKRFTLLNNVLNKYVVELKYATFEAEKPGALSTFISNRITEHDNNWIIGIFGKPGSGKSMAGCRIGMNVCNQSNTKLTIDDVVYDYRHLLKVKTKREQEGTLKGSVQILDEGGIQMDAQQWWSEHILDIVNHIRTQRYQNTCTIIISPMFGDIASKARGLFHSIMIPWKEWSKRYIELTDASNIDYENKTSNWKIDILDTDPMSGKPYLGKMKAALGDIVKLNALLPPKKWVKEYEIKSEEYKKKLQDQQQKKMEVALFKLGDKEIVEEKVEEILANKEKYVRYTKKGKLIVKWIKIKQDTGASQFKAKEIAEKVKEKLENEPANQNNT